MPLGHDLLVDGGQVAARVSDRQQDGGVFAESLEVLVSGLNPVGGVPVDQALERDDGPAVGLDQAGQLGFLGLG